MNNHIENFTKHFPEGFFISLSKKEELADYLLKKGILSKDEKIVTIDKAGEGNMNLTLRIKTNIRSFIVKQSRPWVEKYPQIEAPANRSQVEALFYEVASQDEFVSSKMPKLLKTDIASAVLVLEDLGTLTNFDTIYTNPESAQSISWESLGLWLGKLHSISIDKAHQVSLKNEAMRTLNHAHMYDIPLQPDNGIDLNALSENFADAASFILKDDAYKSKVTALGKLYLQNGDTLLHGDFYPGSWLGDSNSTVFIIDPEFCFIGNPAFDLGVIAAHLAICDSYEDYWSTFLSAYASIKSIDHTLIHQFAGVEIMRRLLGVAQLPITHSTEKRKALLELSHQWVMQ